MQYFTLGFIVALSVILTFEYTVEQKSRKGVR